MTDSKHPSDTAPVLVEELTGGRTVSSRWLPLALLSLTAWGVSGFLSKLASDRITPGSMQVLFTIGTLPLLLAAWRCAQGNLAKHPVGAALAIATGVLTAGGNFSSFAALRAGQASLVTPLIALFPIVTCALAAVSLRERMSRCQYAGVVLALASILLLSL